MGGRVRTRKIKEKGKVGAALHKRNETGVHDGKFMVASGSRDAGYVGVGCSFRKGSGRNTGRRCSNL